MHALLQVPDLLRLLAARLPLRAAAALASTCRRAHEVLRALRSTPPPSAFACYAAEWHHMNQCAAEYDRALRHLQANDASQMLAAASTRQRVLYDACRARMLEVLDALLFDVRGEPRYCTAYDLRNAVHDIWAHQWCAALVLLERRLPALRAGEPLESALCRTSPEWQRQYGEYRAPANVCIASLRGWDYLFALHYDSQSAVARWVLERAVTQRISVDYLASTSPRAYLPCVDCRLQVFFCAALNDDPLRVDDALWALCMLRRWRGPRAASLWLQTSAHRRACHNTGPAGKIWSAHRLGELMLREARAECALEASLVLDALRRLDAECTLCDETLRSISARQNIPLYDVFCDTLRRARAATTQ